jgi:adenylate cyclase, class 2
MMRNVEAKFPLGNPDEVRHRAEALGFTFSAVLIQRDTFFSIPTGKLKLREQPDGAWLIHYHRDHGDKLELSNYEIVALTDGAKVRAMLSAALGVIADVRKRRILLRRGTIRLHLDQVEKLGEFGEIESVVADGSEPADYRVEVEEILGALQIEAHQLISVSYFELMRRPC